MSQTRTCYQFGPFELRMEEYLLFQDGEPITIRAKVFDLLMIFVEKPDYLFSKEELREKLWPEQENINPDEGIQGLVSELRRALGRYENFIETVPRRGYRFKEPVEKVLGASAVKGPISHTPRSATLSAEFVGRIDEICCSLPLPPGADGLSWIIANDALESWKRNVADFVTKGLEMSRPTMMNCNEELLQIAKTVAIVESGCLHYKTAWSDYWKRWLGAINTRTDITDRQYYMLVNPKSFTELDAQNLLATEGFLKSVGLDLSICLTRCLEDFLGEDLPRFDSLNIFGRFILQVDMPRKDLKEGLTFAGGHRLRVWLHDTQQEPTYAAVCRVICDNADKVTPTLIQSLLQSPSTPV